MKKNEPVASDASEEERRAHTRHRVEFFLSDQSRPDGALMGDVLDISLGGMQLVSKKPIATGKEFRCRMNVYLDNGEKEVVEIVARSLWQAKGPKPGYYRAGFVFLTSSDDDKRHIQGIIDGIATDSGTGK